MHPKVGKLLVDAQMRQRDTALSTTINHALAASINMHLSRRMWQLNGGVIIPNKDTARALNDLVRHKAVVRILNDIRMDMEVCENEGGQLSMSDLIDRKTAVNIMTNAVRSLPLSEPYSRAWVRAFVESALSKAASMGSPSRPHEPDHIADADKKGDLISRQAAIDELTEYGSGNSVYMSVGELKRRIETLPSAQPEKRTNERTETHASDLISRQAIINSFRYDDDGTAWDMNDIVYRLEQFPSAQPEPFVDADKLKSCRFEYINACKIVARPTPDTSKNDIYDANAVIKALHPIFGDAEF